MSDKDGSRILGKKSPNRLKNDHPPTKSPQRAYGHNNDDADFIQENKNLRRKLKQLSNRLDQQLGKAAQLRLKRGNHPKSESGKEQWVQAQLQNANKMIERLQKEVRDYESKEAYQVTGKRVMDLEAVIRKKEKETQQLKNQLKVHRKTIMERDKDIQQLIRKSGKEMNPSQDLQAIHKMKIKLKKKMEENQSLRKKQVDKTEKLLAAQKELKELEQDQNSGSLQGAQKDTRKEIEQYKNKYKQAMATIEKQNIEISKLNAKLKTTSLQKKERKQQAIRRSLINSLQELPPMKSLNQYTSEQQLSPKQNRLYINRY